MGTSCLAAFKANMQKLTPFCRQVVQCIWNWPSSFENLDTYEWKCGVWAWIPMAVNYSRFCLNYGYVFRREHFIFILPKSPPPPPEFNAKQMNFLNQNCTSNSKSPSPRPPVPPHTHTLWMFVTWWGLKKKG